MCGIISIATYGIGISLLQVNNMIIKGLSSLEYRGYDAAGACLLVPGQKPFVDKIVNYNTISQKPTKTPSQNASNPTQHQEHPINPQNNKNNPNPPNNTYFSEGLFLKNPLPNLTTDTCTALGHTRWASRGLITKENTHPHTDKTESFFIVHNGTINNTNDIHNYFNLPKKQQTEGSDSAYLPLLISHLYELNPNQDFMSLTVRAASLCQGDLIFSAVSSHFPGELIAYTNVDPIFLGHNAHADHKEYIFSSDNAFPQTTCQKIMKIPGKTITHISRNNLACKRIAFKDEPLPKNLPFKDAINNSLTANLLLNEIPISFENSKNNLEINSAQPAIPGEYKMFQEISEQAAVVERLNALRIRKPTQGETEYSIILPGIEEHFELILKAKKFILIACGTSFHACSLAAEFLSVLTGVPCEAVKGGVFRDRLLTGFFEVDVIPIFVSQSGNTADLRVIAAEFNKLYKPCTDATAGNKQQPLERQSLTQGFSISFTNSSENNLINLTSWNLHISAGAEISVASTKAYTAQYHALICFGMAVNQRKGMAARLRTLIIADLFSLPESLAATLKKPVDSILTRLQSAFNTEKGTASQKEGAALQTDSSPPSSGRMMLLGRGSDYYTCLEGALKISEVSYAWAFGLHAGDLKHGPLSMFTPETPIILLITETECVNEALNAYYEAVTRDIPCIIICSAVVEPQLQGCGAELFVVPSHLRIWQGLINIIPLQLLAYEMAVSRNLNPDRPRALAKSVTVS